MKLDNSNPQKIWDNTSKLPILLFITVSSLLSIYSILSKDVMGRDTFLYMETAQIYLDQGFKAALTNYNWPFFSILVGIFSQITSLSIQKSIELTTILAHITLTLFFFKTSRIIFKDNKTIFISCVLFLCSATMNDYRDTATRDPWFWALTLASFYYFLLAIDLKKPLYLLACLASITLSIFFRTEGIINLLLPLTYPYFRTGKFFFDKRYTVAFIMLSAISLIIFYFLLPTDTKLSAEINYYLNASDILNKIESNQSTITSILPSYSHDYTLLFLIAGISSIFIVKTALCLGPAYTILGLSSLRGIKKFLKNNPLHLLYIAILALPLFIFCFTQYFLSTRYLINFSIALIFPITYVAKEIWTSKNTWKKSAIALLIIISFIDGTVSFNHTDKSYFAESTKWVKENTPARSIITANDKRIIYFLNGTYKNALTHNNGKEVKADYFLMEQNVSDANLIKEMREYGWVQIKSFKSNKSKGIIIYEHKY